MNSPTTIEIWGQDIWNIDLNNRNILTFGARTNYLFPTSQPQEHSTYNTNTKIPRSEKIIQSNSDIRNINVESMLFLNDKVDRRDAITLDEAQNLNKNKYQSNQQLYRTYHNHEINSPCYPNMDRSIWDNTTKAIYQTIDERDRQPHVKLNS